MDNNNNRCLALIHLWTGWCLVRRAFSSWAYSHWLSFLLCLLIITFNPHFNGHQNHHPPTNTLISFISSSSTSTSDPHLDTHPPISPTLILINPSSITTPFSQKLIETSKIYLKSTIYTLVPEPCSQAHLPHPKKNTWGRTHDSRTIIRN